MVSIKKSFLSIFALISLSSIAQAKPSFLEWLTKTGQEFQEENLQFRAGLSANTLKVADKAIEAVNETNKTSLQVASEIATAVNNLSTSGLQINANEAVTTSLKDVAGAINNASSQGIRVNIPTIQIDSSASLNENIAKITSTVNNLGNQGIKVPVTITINNNALAKALVQISGLAFVTAGVVVIGKEAMYPQAPQTPTKNWSERVQRVMTSPYFLGSASIIAGFGLMTHGHKLV